MKELKFKKIYIVYILILPIIFISIFSLVVKVGTIYIGTKELIIDVNKVIGIGDYLTYYIAIVGIEVTALFSYMLFKASVKSNELAMAINDKEENRDKEVIKESALIIYYDLLSKISIMKLLYTKYVLKDDIEVSRKIVMPGDWIKNIANLRKILDKKELDVIFELYNRFELISDLQAKEENQIEKLIQSLSEELFIPVLLKYLWMDYLGENECLLNSKYYMIFNKIEKELEDALNEPEKYSGEIIEGVIVNGVYKWIDNKGNLRYLFKYENNRLVEGKYFNYINGIYETIFDGRFDSENNKFSGSIIEFYNSKRIKYKGKVKDSKYDGQGVLYNDNYAKEPLFAGEWEDGKKYKGEYISKNIYFKGEYKYDKPYDGEIKLDKLYNIGEAYGFKGIIEKGNPLNGFGYKENARILDDEFLKSHPEYEEYDSCEDYDYSENQIPDDVLEEMRENDIRNEKERDIESLKTNCEEIIELLSGKWVNGICESNSDDLLNKEYLGISHGTKKNKK